MDKTEQDYEMVKESMTDERLEEIIKNVDLGNGKEEDGNTQV